MVALFLLSVALRTAASGRPATLYGPRSEAPYFTVLGLIVVVAGLVLRAIARPVLRLMRGVR
jgi:POT family proton-dependent oligopeptide transporter